MANTKSKVIVCFTSPIDTVTDTKQVKAAYKDLCDQITKFATAIATDPNIIVAHSTVAADASAVPGADNPADPGIAELQSINKRIEKGESVVVDPNYKSKFEPKVPVTDEEAPIMVPGSGWQPINVKNIPKPASKTSVAKAENIVEPTKVAEVEPAAKPPVTDTAALKEAIFSTLHATDKSIGIIDYFLKHKDTDVAVSDIVEGTKIKDVSIWLSTTGKSVKAITKTEKRGVYRFDSSKVKVK